MATRSLLPIVKAFTQQTENNNYTISWGEYSTANKTWNEKTNLVNKLDPLKINATKFQKEVYFDLLKIPYGSVKTYNQVATSINNPKANQAVGSACRKNKFIIVIPCHRVIASTGLINGYAGGLKAKTFLLKLEGLQVKDNKIIKLWQIVNIGNINYAFMEITGNDFWNDK